MTLQDLAIEHNLSGEELIMVSNYLLAIKIKESGIKPERVIYVVKNWEQIEKAINMLNYHFKGIMPV